MKEYNDWIGCPLNVAKEEVSHYKNGFVDRCTEGKTENGLDFYMDTVVGNGEVQHIHLFLNLESDSAFSHRDVGVFLFHCSKARNVVGYIMNFKPSPYYSEELYGNFNSIYDVACYLQKMFCFNHGFSSYRMDIMNSYKCMMTLYTYCYSLTITYDLDRNIVEVCFYPKDDDKYHFVIEYPTRIPMSIIDLIGNWETDYFGSRLGARSIVAPREEEEE